MCTYAHFFLDVAVFPFFLQIFEIYEESISNSIEASLIEINLLSFPVLIQIEIIGLFLLFSIFCL